MRALLRLGDRTQSDERALRPGGMGRTPRLLLIVPAGGLATSTQVGAFSSCDPGYAYIVNSYSISFATGSPLYYANDYNNSNEQAISAFTVNSSQAFTVSMTESNGTNFGISYIAEISAQTGESAMQSETKSTGYSISLSVKTPAYTWAHFEAGAAIVRTYGNIDYVNQNCADTWVATQNITAPVNHGITIEDWLDKSPTS